MSERTAFRRHQSHCVHPDPNHDGGCPIYWDTAHDAPQSTAVAVQAPDPWAVPVEPDPIGPQVGILDFHGNPVPVLIDERGRWVSVPALCDAMGIDGEGQRQSLTRKPWSQGWTCVRQVQVPGDVQRRPAFFLHEDRVPMWLGNIDAARIRDPQARARVEATQIEFAEVLAEYAATGQVVPKTQAAPTSVSEALSRGFSPREIAQLVIDAENRREAAEQRVAELEPAAEMTAAFIAQDHEFPIGTVAKMVGTGRVRLFALLRAEGVLIPDGQMKNTPYQRYMDRGLFRVTGNVYVDDDGNSHESHVTLVRPSGLDFIRRLVEAQA